jgi:hypothetical protein
VDYWASLKVDALVLGGGGLMAFYPTKLRNHHRSQFLGNRDLFGEYLEACKKKGIRLVARIETNWLHGEVLNTRPDWFERDREGKPFPHIESAWLYHTCLFSSYHTEQVPAIMREISSLYDVDGFFTNSWPPVGQPRVCYCGSCHDFATRGTKYLYQRQEARIIEICNLLNSVAKEKRWDCVYNINVAGGIGAVLSIKKLAEVGAWLTADHQGRQGDTPIWDCTQQGRVAYAGMKGRPVANVIGSYSTTQPYWRHSSKSPAEATIWMAQCTASGMVPWYVWLGGESQDQRWRATGRSFYQWLAKHEAHFANRGSVANLGVVWSQRTNAFYRGPGRVRGGYDVRASEHAERAANPTEYLQGLYYALLEGRFLFDFVHEDDLGPETLKKYAALLLPNVAAMSDEQCRRLRAYVQSGGSLLATFETSLFNEWGEPRAEFGLADVFGIKLAGKREGPLGNSFYSRIEHPHEILEGFQDTKWLPGAEHWRPVQSSGGSILTIIPPYPGSPPEMAYPHSRKEWTYAGAQTDQPAVVVVEKERSRLVYFPGDIDRSAWLSGNTDLSRLLQNSVRWILRHRSPVTIEGEGMIEAFAWETQPGFALHILNYNNPNMTRAWVRRFYPIGPQQVRFELPLGVGISRLELLRTGIIIPYKQSGRNVEFVIPQVEDYEVAALYRA